MADGAGSGHPVDQDRLNVLKKFLHVLIRYENKIATCKEIVMTRAVKSVLTAEGAPICELVSDALGLIAISVIMGAVLWLPAILSA